MPKLFATVALLSLLIPTSALGGPARLESLGSQGMFLEDSSNVFTNPACWPSTATARGSPWGWAARRIRRPGASAWTRTAARRCASATW